MQNAPETFHTLAAFELDETQVLRVYLGIMSGETATQAHISPVLRNRLHGIERTLLPRLSYCHHRVSSARRQAALRRTPMPCSLFK